MDGRWRRCAANPSTGEAPGHIRRGNPRQMAICVAVVVRLSFVEREGALALFSLRKTIHAGPL